MGMRVTFLAGVVLLCAVLVPAPAKADEPRDAERDILVTFVNAGRATRTGVGAPYRNRKRYSVAAAVRRQAADVAEEYSLVEVDSWPIKALSVYCVVYRVADADGREALLRRLQTDQRVESAQAVNEFETSTSPRPIYDDTYLNLQHGIATMAVSAAHRHSVGRGVRVAIVDSDVDRRHEDLESRLDRVQSYSADGKRAETGHGTAIASVIGAQANNAKGIVGVAPRAEIDVYAACWAASEAGQGICDSFSLAKALDTLVSDPPDVVNLSLTGPRDELLARLIKALSASGAVIVAALASDLTANNHFPASMDEVIAAGSSADGPARASRIEPGFADVHGLYAPGKQILVAVPENRYDFRSGSSIAAAHVTGVVALLLADDPRLSSGEIRDLLARSQAVNDSGLVSINACAALKFADPQRDCT